jgi:HPt (histidine-containing phosphotransfer) domain-containing protein
MDVASSPADGLPLAAQQQFEGLRQCFAVGLDARWRDISQAADLPAQQALLHRLCGSAGSFGFERLGQLAREAEEYCASGDTAALAVSLRQLEFEINAALPLPTAS